MVGVLGLVPIPFDQGGVGVVAPKQPVGEAGHPHVPLIGLPGFHRLRAGDHRAARDFRTVGDAAGVALAAVLGVHPFPVIAGQDDDLIPGHRHPGGLGDGLERRFFRAGAAAPGAGGNINLQNDSSFKSISPSKSAAPLETVPQRRFHSDCSMAEAGCQQRHEIPYFSRSKFLCPAPAGIMACSDKRAPTPETACPGRSASPPRA